MIPELRKKYEESLHAAKQPGSGCSEGYIAHLQDIINGDASVFSHHQSYDPDHEREFSFAAIQERVKKTKRQEQENEERLGDCSFHVFKETADTEFLSSSLFIPTYWKCENCGGRISETQKEWYEKGMRHARTYNPTKGES